MVHGKVLVVGEGGGLGWRLLYRRTGRTSVDYWRHGSWVGLRRLWCGEHAAASGTGGATSWTKPFHQGFPPSVRRLSVLILRIRCYVPMVFTLSRS